MPGNLRPELPLFTFATVTAADCIIAARQGKREAGSDESASDEAEAR
jgi:hypothetical protein